MPLKALVLGGTGAVGRYVIGELATSPNVSVVTSLSRRPATIPEEYKVDQKDIENAGKLVHVTADFENLNPAVFQGQDVVFCSLGTTRRDAGSAENFKKIDQDYVVNAARVAKEAGVPHFLYVSSVGANANSFFLYLQSKGETENRIAEQEFRKTSIFRPGFIDRGGQARFVEKLSRVFVSGVKCQVIARAMLKVAEQFHASQPTGSTREVYDDATIRSLGTNPNERAQ